MFNHRFLNGFVGSLGVALVLGGVGCSGADTTPVPEDSTADGLHSTPPAASAALTPLWSKTGVGQVEALAFSPDGSSLATGGGGTAKIWRASDGALVRDLGRRSGNAEDLAFSADGALLAVGNGGGPDLNLHVYSVADGFLPFGRLAGHHNGTRGVAYSRDGRHLITGGGKGETKIWNTSDMTVAKTFDDGRTNIQSVALSPDGSLIASGADGAIHLWDVAGGVRVGTLLSPLPAYPHDTLSESSIAFSPNGALLAAPSKEGVTIWNVATRAVVRVLSRAPAGVYTDAAESIAFSPDGQTIVSSIGYWQYPGDHAAPRSASIRFWRVSDGALRKEYDLGTAATVHVAFDPTGKRFAYGLYEGTVAVATTPL